MGLDKGSNNGKARARMVGEDMMRNAYVRTYLIKDHRYASLTALLHDHSLIQGVDEL